MLSEAVSGKAKTCFSDGHIRWMLDACPETSSFFPSFLQELNYSHDVAYLSYLHVRESSFVWLLATLLDLPLRQYYSINWGFVDWYSIHYFSTQGCGKFEAISLLFLLATVIRGPEQRMINCPFISPEQQEHGGLSRSEARARQQRWICN